ncbi:MAG: pitrilysin family protein [Ginsengibacter sp.]
MKRFNIPFSIILLLIISIHTYAQKAEKFEVQGITVIMKPTVKDIINVNVYFKGGVTNYPEQKAGIENLALSATTECGTASYPTNVFKDKADKYGIILSGSSSFDYGMISMNCIGKYFNEGWDLLSSAVKNPVFNEKDYGLLQQKVLADIKNSDSDPDNKLSKMGVENAFKGTPYATDPKGNLNAVNSISAKEARDYYFNTLLNKKRMLIVVVGKISKQDIIHKIQNAFQKIPTKTYTEYTYRIPEINSNTLFTEPRKLATNYIMGIFNAPLFTSDDYAANRLAIAAFSDNLFKEIRTKRNLSYAPYAFSQQFEIPYSYMYVSTTDPKASAEVMVNEINRLKSEGFSQKEFDDIRNLFITMNYMKEESTDRMASSLGQSELLGNWKMDEEFIRKIQKITPADMTRVFKKYIHGINWNYLGDESAADNAKAAFEKKVE